MKDQGATVVINHQIKDGKQNQYEKWLDEIGSICRSYVGNIDWQIIRPIPNLTYDYTVIIRFDTTENLTIWMKSKDREYLIEKARPLFSKDDHYQIKSGLDFLFSDNSDKKKKSCSLETIFGYLVCDLSAIRSYSITYTTPFKNLRSTREQIYQFIFYIRCRCGNNGLFANARLYKTN